jgi:glutamine amidotransferase
LFRDIAENEYVYFVHGFYVEACSESICTTDYTQKYSSGLNKDNFYALQFHPEKSGLVGQKILENFIKG